MKIVKTKISLKVKTARKIRRAKKRKRKKRRMKRKIRSLKMKNQRRVKNEETNQRILLLYFKINWHRYSKCHILKTKNLNFGWSSKNLLISHLSDTHIRIILIIGWKLKIIWRKGYIWRNINRLKKFNQMIWDGSVAKKPGKIDEKLI